ncbi:MAG: DUF1893 domain-containing protein [Bacteroides sp.]|nr:DUF1893 domain-containing protein [Eubacterium sp.]MCM1417441.1 DUF1893 domain-containing protein [Roseburia sp.]MCM1461621.1 DUF1893 domain-containing protein [Bacteroides sp.]
MRSDTARAKAVLEEKGLSCVLCYGERIIESDERGIKPLVRIVGSGEELRGYSAADRIVGKAAAWLYLLLGIGELYAEVLSRPAARLLEENEIPYSYGVLTEEIINRDQTGQCPMETAVADCTSPKEAYEAIREKLKRLAEMKG